MPFCTMEENLLAAALHLGLLKMAATHGACHQVLLSHVLSAAITCKATSGQRQVLRKYERQ